MLTAVFFVTTCYGIASFYIYTLIILMMFRRWKEYNATFFKIYIIEYFFNVITFANSYITLRAPQNTCNDCYFSFLFESRSNPDKDNSPLSVFYTIHYSMAFIQYSMTCLSSLNRLTMVLLVENYEKWWKPLLPWCIILIVMYPVMVTHPILLNNAYYVYTPKLKGYSTKSVVDVTDILNNLIGFMVVITSLTAIANMLTVIRLKLLKSRITGAEKSLFTVSFVSFCIQVLALIDTLILRYAVDDYNRSSVGAQFALALMPFVSDLLTLIHPWSLIYFSAKVRNAMANDHFSILKFRVSGLVNSLY